MAFLDAFTGISGNQARRKRFQNETDHAAQRKHSESTVLVSGKGQVWPLYDSSIAKAGKMPKVGALPIFEYFLRFLSSGRNCLKRHENARQAAATKKHWQNDGGSIRKTMLFPIDWFNGHNSVNCF